MESVKLKIGDKIRYDDSGSFKRSDIFDGVVITAVERDDGAGMWYEAQITNHIKSSPFFEDQKSWSFRQCHADLFVTVLEPAQASTATQA